MGYWTIGGGDSEDNLNRTVTRMADVLRARGPDDHGTWTKPALGLALGHRRLSVIDVSSSGHQPMQSADGRMVISYNGELYNTAELRRDLEREGQRFLGHSDTEVLVEACASWGLDAAVKRLSGMFAFALWDDRDQAVYLVRDRLGIKPLYWGRQDRTFFFGSQLKAFRAHPDWRPELDRDAVATYLRFGYVPTPYAIYKGMAKLEPGHILKIDTAGRTEKRRYWSLDRIDLQAGAISEHCTDEEATDALETRLRDAIRRHMVSDVPVGVFLSGGIDSASVAALMQAESAHPVKSFSIGFTEEGYDEAVHARPVARHIGSDHTELKVSPREAMDVLPDLTEMFDEPFADSSQIPTYLVSRLARKDVTVALTGDGGDELFAGYNRYVWGERFRNRLLRLPGWVRAAISRSVGGVSSNTWDKVFSAVPKGFRPVQAGDKMHKIAGLFAHSDRDGFYRYLVSQWHDPDELVRGASELPTALDEGGTENRTADFMAWMQRMDMQGYLPDDILTKVDRASMGVSLEARVPLLDTALVEFSWSLARKMKIRNGESKWLLRQVLDRYVPRRLVDRPKMGFGVPVGDWLRTGLRDWAEDLLETKRLEEGNLFHAAPIRRLWQSHLSTNQNRQHPLWVILMLQAWLASTKCSVSFR